MLPILGIRPRKRPPEAPESCQSNGQTVTPALQVLAQVSGITTVGTVSGLLPYVYVNVVVRRRFLSGKGYKTAFVTCLTFV